MQADGTAQYVVPTYEAPATVAFYHFLHGNVPGHQIDFIYQPNVPQGGLTQQHFSHLARLVKYIEPRSRNAPAFAIGNLSRDDTQYEPGRGGVAFIIGLRIRGAKDHAGRQAPPFCHALAAIGRHLDTDMLFETAISFYSKVLPNDDQSQGQSSGWYHTYVQHAQNTDALVPILRAYLEGFADLPAPPPSRLGLRWTIEGARPPRRIVIAHDDETPLESIAACAARIAGVLVESDIRWTAISTGREADVPGGMSVRFVPHNDVGPEEPHVPVWRMSDVPEDSGELARRLFGAKEVCPSSAPERRVGWRQLYGTHVPEAITSPPGMNALQGQGQLSNKTLPTAPERPLPWAEEEAVEEDIPVYLAEDSEPENAIEAAARPASPEHRACEKPDGLNSEGAANEGAAARSRARLGLLVGIAVALVIGGAVAAVVLERHATPGDPVPALANAPPAPASTPPAPAETLSPGRIEPPEQMAPTTQAPAGAPMKRPLAGGGPLPRRPLAGQAKEGKAGIAGARNSEEKGKPRSVYEVP